MRILVVDLKIWTRQRLLEYVHFVCTGKAILDTKRGDEHLFCFSLYRRDQYFNYDIIMKMYVA